MAAPDNQHCTFVKSVAGTRALAAISLALILLTTSCETPETRHGNENKNAQPRASSNVNSNRSVAVAVPAARMFTLPVLATFLSNQNFTQDLKTRLQLSDDQISRLQSIAQEHASEQHSKNPSSFSARKAAAEKVEPIVGADKTKEIATLVNQYWSESVSAGGGGIVVPEPSPTPIPSDTRVVVNAPAYRLDVFDRGQLIKSYKVGIGYPEFPLPTGVRLARTIIFNPVWVPPESPWVKDATKVKPGQRVEAGSTLNPLGIAKIPIGLPSLIHGGKAPAKIGGFASHGCVGLTDAQMREFVQELARLSGTNLTPEEVDQYKRNRSQTKEVKLKTPVPVELRYDTIVPVDGKLHIYRDVYDMDTNTEDNLSAVLSKYGVRVEDMTPSERESAKHALVEMSRDASGHLDQEARSQKSNSSSTARLQVAALIRVKSRDQNPEAEATGRAAIEATRLDTSKKQPKSGKVTRTVKGAREMVVEVAALRGKGYPAPVGMDSATWLQAPPSDRRRRTR